MSVESMHPIYARRMDQWKTIRDCIEGEDAIKAAGERYLPRASGSDTYEYEAYKRRARWNNYTARNLEGLHGLVMRRVPVISCSTEFRTSGVLENIDRKGTSFYQFVSDSLFDAMQTSFGGYLLDLPETDGTISKLDAEKQGIRPYLRYYAAESIINWGWRIIDGIEQLAFVVLREIIDDPFADEFDHVPRTRYRVLEIVDGIYRQRIFNWTFDKNGAEIPEETGRVVNIVINGKSISYIPFVTVPSREPEKPMFYDLAMCNIGHYQKSADYENGVHLTTIPTGYVTGHRQVRGPEDEPETIRLGGDSFLIFEESEAKVGTLVFSGEGLSHSETAITSALTDMAVLGSRLIAPEKGVNESADSAKIHRAGENARLATFATNYSEALSKAMTWLARWDGYDETITISLCTDYDTLSFDPNALNALANLAEAGKLPAPYVFYNLKNGEYAPTEADFEEYAILLQMEQVGMTPLEQLDFIRKKRKGETTDIDIQSLVSQSVAPDQNSVVNQSNTQNMETE